MSPTLPHLLALEDIRSRSEVDRRLEIATATGWSAFENTSTIIPGGCWVGYPPHGADAVIGAKLGLPDYYRSLDACHQAETILFDLLVRRRHWLQLNFALGFNKGMQVGHWHMEPADRADAILLTLALPDPDETKTNETLL